MKGLPAILFLLAAVVLSPRAARCEDSTGHLVLLGGGERPRYVMDRIAELAGGRSGRLLVVPTASSRPGEAAETLMAELEASGVRSEVLAFERDSADTWENLERVRQATGVFFAGGDQARLAAALEGTELLGAMLELYHRGGVIAGSSAGATVLGELMVVGAAPADQDPDRAVRSIRTGAVDVRRGLGFMPRTIVDQHFVRRRRHNRLLTAALEHPALLALGIDEATAVVVAGGRRFEVLGENLVVVYDLSWGSPVDTDRNGNLTASGISMHLMASGQAYDLEARGVERP